MSAWRRLTGRVCLIIGLTLVPNIAFSENPAPAAAESSVFERMRMQAVAEREAKAAEYQPKDKLVGSMVPSKSDLLGRTLKGIIYSVGLFGLLLVLFRRFRPTQQSTVENIRVLSRKAIAPRMQLLIIEVENRRLLLSLTSENMNLVTELSPASDDSRSTWELGTEELGESKEDEALIRDGLTNYRGSYRIGGAR